MKIDGISSLQGTTNAAEKVTVEKAPVNHKIAGSAEVRSENRYKDTEKYVSDHVEVINDEMLDKAIKVANKTLKQHNKFIERSIHEVTKTVMYVIKDTETNEVIREFPPKKIQDMIAKMWEMAGLFVDEKA